jgi:glucose/arabinose dehydrogenase
MATCSSPSTSRRETAFHFGDNDQVLRYLLPSGELVPSSGTQFPRHYRNGAFVAFHGGFDRAPLPNEGFKVMFVPMTNGGQPTGAAEVFADIFAGATGPLPATAKHRPVGVAEGPDGSLSISDDRGGRIWRVVFIGKPGAGNDESDGDR